MNEPSTERGMNDELISSFNIDELHKKNFEGRLLNKDANLGSKILEDGDTAMLLDSIDLSEEVLEQIKCVLKNEGRILGMRSLLKAVVKEDKVEQLHDALVDNGQKRLAEVMREEYEKVVDGEEDPHLDGELLYYFLLDYFAFVSVLLAVNNAEIFQS